MNGLSKTIQLALAALVLSLLTFAASVAEVPRSEFAPQATSSR